MTDATTHELLTEADALDKAATPGPWEAIDGTVMAWIPADPNSFDQSPRREDVGGGNWGGEGGGYRMDDADAKFIARARTLLPALAVALREAEADLASARRAGMEEAAVIAKRTEKGYSQHPDDRLWAVAQERIASAIRAAIDPKEEN